MQRTHLHVACFEPLADQFPCGKRPDGLKHSLVRDRVEGSFYVRIQDPLLALVGARNVEDLGYGIVATSSWSEAVAGRLEMSFPVRLQGVLYDRLHHPVMDCGDAQRTHLAVSFGYVDPPCRSGLPRLVGPDLVHQLASSLRCLHHEHIHTRRVPARIDLRHPAHTQKSVRIATQHELLQRPDLTVVAFLRCPEDAPSEVADGPLDLAPVDCVPVGIRPSPCSFCYAFFSTCTQLSP